ncbi:AbiJ-NTD4 domain-containing protein [Pseudomonas rustica]|uniref:AbiJ-NTD4 domain-containing protein n=1 Tax=Pseudomonas rustica TaxID=2827099 RepID=UPI003CF53ABE
MKFSHRNNFDPNRQQGPIVEDAPMWLRDEFFITVLSKLTYIDLDSRVKNKEKLPLGIKKLNERLCIETQRQMDEQDWDSWTCNDGLAYTIKHCEWYQFYDCVEAVGDELKSVEPFYLGAPGFVDFSTLTFDAYRAKVNEILAKHQVGWRLNSRSQLESALPKDLADRIDGIEKKLDQFDAAREHFRKAKRYVLGTHKDYENSIKESVSAFESVGKVLYNKTATLGDVLSRMKKDGSVPPMLVNVMEKFYAYANAEPGVRHGGTQKPKSDEMDAELAMHLSAAFIRYAIELQSQKLS